MAQLPNAATQYSCNVDNRSNVPEQRSDTHKSQRSLKQSDSLGSLSTHWSSSRSSSSTSPLTQPQTTQSQTSKDFSVDFPQQQHQSLASSAVPISSCPPTATTGTALALSEMLGLTVLEHQQRNGFLVRRDESNRRDLTL